LRFEVYSVYHASSRHKYYSSVYTLERFDKAREANKIPDAVSSGDIMATIPIDLKQAVLSDIEDLDNILVIVNSLKKINLARLEVLKEAEKRTQEEEWPED
jgi:hypothetical protein